MALGLQCLKRYLQGIRQNPVVFMPYPHNRGSVGVDLYFLGTRGNRMDSTVNQISESSSQGALQTTIPGASSEVPVVSKEGASSEALPIKKNRSGSQKKRVRKFKQKQQAQKGATSSSNAETSSKRGREDGTTPPSDRQTLKRARPCAYNQAAKSMLRVAIAGSNFPGSVLSIDFANSLQESLSRVIDALPEEAQVPRFDEFKLSEQGIIMVTCCDSYSKEWLTSGVGMLSPFKGTALQILEGEALPKLRKMVAFVPGAPVDRATILQRIKRSTPGLQTGTWKIRDVITVPNKGSRLILGVDQKSAEVLQKINFSGYAGMSKVSFWDPTHKKGVSEGEMPSDSSAPKRAEERMDTEASEGS